MMQCWLYIASEGTFNDEYSLHATLQGALLKAIEEVYEWLEDSSDTHFHEKEIINQHMTDLKKKKTDDLREIFCYFSDLAEEHLNIWIYIRSIDMEP